MRSLLITLVLVPQVALASMRGGEGNEVCQVSADGKVTVEKEKLTSFDESKSPKFYFKESHGLQASCSVVDATEGRVIVSFAQSSSNNHFSDTYSFQNRELDAYTRCLGSDCRSVNKGVCAGMKDLYKSGGGLGELTRNVDAKHRECSSYMNDVYNKIFRPQFEQLQASERENLKLIGDQMIRHKKGNFFKAIKTALVNTSSAMKDKTLVQFKSDQDMLMTLMDVAADCERFERVSGSQGLRPVAALPAADGKGVSGASQR